MAGRKFRATIVQSQRTVIWQPLNERNEDRRLVVPDTLDSPHPLAERTERSLRSARPDSEGRVCPKARRCLSVTVAPGSIDRAMCIMDTLVKALESRGYPVTTADEDSRATHVEIMGEMISFYLAEILDKKVRELTASEKRERERYAWLSSRRPEYTHFPSGRLTISIDGSFGNTRSRRRWSDGQKQSLENLLNQVVAGLLQASEDTKTARHEREERERRFQEERRQRHEVEIRRREAEIRGKDFESRVAAWARANELRLFVDAVRVGAVQRNEPIDESSEVGRWLLWAERCVSGLDPLDAGKPLPVYSVPDETKEFWRQELSRGW